MPRQFSVDFVTDSEEDAGGHDDQNLPLLQPPAKRQRTASSSHEVLPAERVVNESDAADVPAVKCVRKKKKKRRRTLQERKELFAAPQRLEKLLQTSCRKRCRNGCFALFRQREQFERLRKFRMEWASVHKLDQDQAVPKSQGCSSLNVVHGSPS